MKRTLSAMALLLLVVTPAPAQQKPPQGTPTPPPTTAPRPKSTMPTSPEPLPVPSFMALPNTIQVSIKLAEEGPLPSLRVLLYYGGNQVRASRCQGLCEISFGDLKDGTYTVQAEAPVYEINRQDVSVTNGETVRVTLLLRRLGAHAEAFSVSDPLVSARWLAVPEAARQELQQAREARDRKDYAAAIAHGDAALKIDPKIALAHADLGLSYWRAGELDKAQQAFESAIRLDAAYLSAYLGLADLLADKRDYKQAGMVLLQASKAQPQRAEPYVAMARIQLRTGHPDKAEQACKLGLARDYSRAPEIHLVLANVYLRLGDKVKAAAALQSYLRAVPAGGQSDEAREMLRKLENEPKSTAAQPPAG